MSLFETMAKDVGAKPYELSLKKWIFGMIVYFLLVVLWKQNTFCQLLLRSYHQKWSLHCFFGKFKFLPLILALNSFLCLVCYGIRLQSIFFDQDFWALLYDNLAHCRLFYQLDGRVICYAQDSIIPSFDQYSSIYFQKGVLCILLSS